MFSRPGRAVKAYLASAWIPLGVTLATAVITTLAIAWLQARAVPEGTTFYDHLEDPGLWQRELQYLDLLSLNGLAWVGMLVAAVFQLVTRRMLKGIINLFLAFLLALPLLLLPVAVLSMLSECASLAVCTMVSGERLLRYEFGIPANVELTHLHSPTGTSFFGREGLRIDATFRFTHDQLQRYLAEQEDMEIGWEPLPVPRDLLWHVGRIEGSVQREIERENRNNEQRLARGEEPWPSLYSEDYPRPTEQDRFESFLSQLPPFPERGYYTCRSAGTNVLYAVKTTCMEPDRVNDFILGLLDTTALELRIKVRTYY